MARAQKGPDFDKAGDQVDHAETGDGSTHEVIGNERLEHGQGLQEVVPLPIDGPRNEQKHEAGFEEERRQ